MVNYRGKVLQCINDRNVILQAGKISLEKEVADISVLKHELQALRDKWDSLLSEATLVATQMDVPPQFNKEQRNRNKEEIPPDCENIFLLVKHLLCMHIKGRKVRKIS